MGPLPFKLEERGCDGQAVGWSLGSRGASFGVASCGNDVGTTNNGILHMYH